MAGAQDESCCLIHVATKKACCRFVVFVKNGPFRFVVFRWLVLYLSVCSHFVSIVDHSEKLIL